MNQATFTRSRRWMIGAALVAALGASAYAADTPAMPGHGMHGHGMHGHHGMDMDQMDPAAMSQHLDGMIAHIAPDATADQKARLKSIGMAAFKDLKPLHQAMADSHQKMHELLKQPAIDRAALERLRQQHVQQMDALSKRVLAAVEDAADVLTPAQRAKFADHLQQRMH